MIASDSVERGPSGAQTLCRALKLSRLIVEAHPDGLRMSDLVGLTGLNKSTVHRLLKELFDNGLVSRDASKRYRLGRFAYEMGVVASAHYGLREVCEPSLDRIAMATGDTVFLALRSGSSGFCVDYRLGLDVRPPVVPPKGFTQPLGVGASSVAILSKLSDVQVDAIIASNKNRLARYRRSAEAVSGLVREAQQAGYSKVRNHFADGVVALGTSVSDATGRPMLSISVATTAGRMSSYHQRDSLDALFAEAQVLKQQICRDGVLMGLLGG